MAETCVLRAVHPVLPVRDVAAALAFYVDRLGFRELFRDDPAAPCYAGIGRDGVELHVQWHDAAEWVAGVDRPMLRFLVTDPDALHAEWLDRGVYHERTALRDTAWGTREFAFYDPDHNGLTFYRNR